MEIKEIKDIKEIKGLPPAQRTTLWVVPYVVRVPHVACCECHCRLPHARLLVGKSPRMADIQASLAG